VINCDSFTRARAYLLNHGTWSPVTISADGSKYSMSDRQALRIQGLIDVSVKVAVRTRPGRAPGKRKGNARPGGSHFALPARHADYKKTRRRRLLFARHWCGWRLHHVLVPVLPGILHLPSLRLDVHCG
jgi:hypothetical protein